MANLTKDEKAFVIYCLQYVWTDASLKLEGRELGDIERKSYEYAKNKSKELISKLEWE